MVKNIIQCRKGRMSRMSTDNGRKSEDRANSQFISSQYSLKKLESHPILSICSRLLVAIWLLWNPERSWIVWSRTWTTSSTTLKPSASTPWAWRVRQRRTLASSSGRAKVLVPATGMLPRPCGQTGKDSASEWLVSLICKSIFAQERRVDPCEGGLPLRLHGDRPNHCRQRALVAQRLQRRGNARNLWIWVAVSNIPRFNPLDNCMLDLHTFLSKSRVESKIFLLHVSIVWKIRSFSVNFSYLMKTQTTHNLFFVLFQSSFHYTSILYDQTLTFNVSPLEWHGFNASRL